MKPSNRRARLSVWLRVRRCEVASLDRKKPRDHEKNVDRYDVHLSERWIYGRGAASCPPYVRPANHEIHAVGVRKGFTTRLQRWMQSSPHILPLPDRKDEVSCVTLKWVIEDCSLQISAGDAGFCRMTWNKASLRRCSTLTVVFHVCHCSTFTLYVPCFSSSLGFNQHLCVASSLGRLRGCNLNRYIFHLLYVLPLKLEQQQPLRFPVSSSLPLRRPSLAHRRPNWTVSNNCSPKGVL